MTRFDGFVLLAEMRTGSNYLEETLNLFPRLRCHGEVFNPAFVGQHDGQALFGMDRAARDAEPLEMMRRVFEQPDGLGGFRLFHDHDPSVFDAVLPNPRIAKVLLTRNPLDSYVSRKIASETGQWRLTDEKHRKSARIRFDAAEFAAFHDILCGHMARLQRILQCTGQSAFQIAFEQTGDVEVINGLARYLGETNRLEAASGRLKRQNPASLEEKVENFEEMRTALAEMDLSGMIQVGEAEPRHQAAVQNFVAATQAPLLFMPLKGGPTEGIEDWLAGVSGSDGTVRGFTRKTLRQWKNQNKAARSFTVVCHPVERAHAVFNRYILDCGPGSFSGIRHKLRVDFDLPIPEGPVDARFGARERRAAFLGFLRFLKKNLSGQTALRTDPAFSSQASLVQDLSEVMTPDMVIRAEQLPLGLAQLAHQVGQHDLPPCPSVTLAGSAELNEIYDVAVEAAARAVYNRDFMTFGFRRWKQ